MKPYYSDAHVTLHHGDCVEVMAALPDASVDSIVTDPPYGLGFMGKAWDDLPPGLPWARECLRVLKPGGHLLAFGGTRTWHRLAVAVEDAGFEIRDSIAWMSGSGFPKSRNVSRDLDPIRCQCEAVESNRATTSETEHAMPGVRLSDVPQAQGTQRGSGAVLLTPMSKQGSPQQGGEADPALRAGQSSMERRGYLQAAEGELRRPEVRAVPDGMAGDGAGGRLRDGAQAGHGAVDRSTIDSDRVREPHQPEPAGQPQGEPRAVPDERRSQARGGWPVCERCSQPVVPDGLGTALKPAFEPVVVARKPLRGTVAANVLEYGTGALNVDATRIGRKDGDRTDYGLANGSAAGIGYHGLDGRTPYDGSAGRWPANVVLDESQADALDEMSGDSASKPERSGRKGGMTDNGTLRGYGTDPDVLGTWPADPGGGASRFFYVASDDVTVSKGGMIEPCGTANTAAQNSSQQREPGGSAQSDAATSASHAGNSSRPQAEPSMSATGSASRPSAASVTQQIPSTEGAYSLASQPEGHSQTSNPANPAARQTPTATTTTTTNPSTSDGSAALATSSTTPKSKAHGAAALPIDSLGSRFTYTAKASTDERITHNGVAHPTVKPLSLMRWLVRLVTPPGGTVLEPFAGSGTTVEACILEGFRCIAIERGGPPGTPEHEYLPMIVQRINRRRDPVEYLTAAGEDLGLFGEPA